MYPDIDLIKSFMREAAEQCIMPRYQNLKDGDISCKSDATDLVTCADTEAEALMTQRLLSAYPAMAILGEEQCAKSNDALTLLQQTQQNYFVIDPVDGTSNFVNGTANFGMILAYVHRGVVCQGYIFDPLNDNFMIAERGSGTYDGSTPVFMSDNHLLNEGIGKCKYFDEGLKRHFNHASLAHNITTSILGCSAHEYMNLLRGKKRFYFANRVKPWDHLAGSLIVREGGGLCKTWENKDYKPRDYEGSILSANSWDDWRFIARELLNINTAPNTP